MHRLVIDRSRSMGALALLAAALVVSGCSNKQRLHEYDFRGKTVSVVALAPSRPVVLGGLDVNVDVDDPVGTLVRAGTELAREASIDKLRARLDSASMHVDVADRMAARVLEHGARHLRAVPVEGTPASVDYEIELALEHYGVRAASWTEGAEFEIEGDMTILDGATGRRIWQTHVRAWDPVDQTVVNGAGRSVTNVVTAIALANMSVEEIRVQLESLADFAADFLVQELADALNDARD